MWRFPFIDTGCLNATYYFSDRLGEARTQSRWQDPISRHVAGRNKITLQNLFLLLMTCSGGRCPPPRPPPPALVPPPFLASASAPTLCFFHARPLPLSHPSVPSCANHESQLVI